MLNILIAGIGGQGSVLAAKILAQTASDKGWQVRTAETIGMAQRGGNVTSHVRIGNLGETVEAPLIAAGTADCIIALEPGEGIRTLPYLAPEGLMVIAETAVPSVNSNLAGTPYEAGEMLDYLKQQAPYFISIGDGWLLEELGNRKMLNVVMLTAAITYAALEGLPLGSISPEDLKRAIAVCVKERFVELNHKAVDMTYRELTDLR